MRVAQASAPATVERVSGRRVDLWRDDGALLKGQHLENLVELPVDVDDWEREPQQDLPAPEDDSEKSRLSPGQLLERKAAGSVPLPVVKAKLRGLGPGCYVACASGGPERTRIGKVLEVSEAEGFVVVHRHRAVPDSRLRICWEPLFVVGGAGAVADRESVPRLKLLAVVDVHSGVLAHSNARALDHAGWCVDEGGPAAHGGLQLH